MVVMVQPNVQWRQSKDHVIVTFEARDSKDVKIDINEKIVKFSAKDGDNRTLESEIHLMHPVKKDDSVFSVKRSVVVALAKEDPEIKWTHLLENKNKPSWLKVDWSNFENSDDEGISGNPPALVAGC